MRALRGKRPQRDLANAMRARGWNWSQTTVWQAEAGQRPLRLAEAADLADELGISVDRLLGRTDDEGPLAEYAAAREQVDELSQLLDAAMKRMTRARKALERYEWPRVQNLSMKQEG